MTGVAALARLPLLAGAPEAALHRLAGRTRWIDAQAGQLVIGYEDLTTDVYLIVQGAVRVTLRSVDGERVQILGDFKAGEILGEMSAIDDEPRSAQVEALVRTRLGIMPAPAFLEAVFSAPAIGLRLMQSLTARIRGQNRRLLEHTALPMRLRLAAELLRLSHARADGGRVVSPPPTQEELASRIGARRETVSREAAALARLGLLQRTRAAFILPDPTALRSLVENAGDPRAAR